MTIEIPTCEQLCEEDGFERVHREADPSWRHGSYVTDVYRRTKDNTYWQASYCLSGDGETNELREGLADILQVVPVQKTITAYEPVQAA